MKVKLLNSNAWDEHKRITETQFRPIGTFKGHKGYPSGRFPCYVVSYVEVQDDMDCYIRHIFVSGDEFFPPTPKPSWRLPLIVFMILIFCVLTLKIGSEVYRVYNPPAVPVQVQKCEKAADEVCTATINELKSSHTREVNELKSLRDVCKSDLETAENRKKEEMNKLCDDVLAEKRSDLLKKIRAESYEILTLTGKDTLEYSEECY